MAGHVRQIGDIIDKLFAFADDLHDPPDGTPADLAFEVLVRMLQDILKFERHAILFTSATRR